MNKSELLLKAIELKFLTIKEGLFLSEHAGTAELIFSANEMRKKIKNNSNQVGWMIDRNVNITNICYAQCKFCNFSRKITDTDTYITTIDEYKQKIDELISLGGNQLLLQGGLHPKFGLDFYKNLFSEIKKLYPQIKLHALGPAEIHHIAKLEKASYREILQYLIEAGLDSLPGAGAEILSDRVRTLLSKGKCNTQQWLDVMREAHKLNMTTSATMMFGHIETSEERFEHMMHLRQVQSEKTEGSTGFVTFVLWPFQDEYTVLKNNENVVNKVTHEEYIRMLALSRLMLPNIKNIQASWLTVGKEAAQICLHGGANDFGSIMIEENVVSSAGANFKFDKEGIQRAISEAGFVPHQRNQKYEFI